MEVDGQYFQPASDPASSTWTIARGYWRENQQMTDGRGCRHGRHAPNPHLGAGPIGQELDFSDPLL
jgi:hypothetical protein